MSAAIDKDQLRALRAAIDAALEPIRTAHGLDMLRLGNCSFDPEGPFHFKLEGRAAVGKTKEALTYEANCRYSFMPPLGEPVKVGSRTYRVTGMRATKCIVTMEGKPGLFLVKFDDIGKAWRAAHPVEAKAHSDRLFGKLEVSEVPR